MTPTSKKPTAWFAVHSKTMSERLAADALARKGFGVLLPMATVRVRHARRTHVVARPLFRRYLFVELDEQHPPFAEVRKTWGVEWLVTNVDKPVRIRTPIIEALRAAEKEGAFDETKPPPDPEFKAGDAVKVTEGLFADMIAEIVALPSDRRIEVIFRSVGQQPKVTLPLAILRKVS